MADGVPTQATIDLNRRAPDGAYASIPPGGRNALATELAPEPAEVRLAELCAAWGVQPITTDEVTDYAAQQPSTLGTGGS
jgi:hypothetical protein